MNTFDALEAVVIKARVREAMGGEGPSSSELVRELLVVLREPSNRALEAGLGGYMLGLLACHQAIIDTVLKEGRP
jgi:hypothetical protein